MIDEVAGIAIDALVDVGSTSDPQRRRRGCRQWLIAFCVASVLLAVIVIVLTS